MKNKSLTVRLICLALCLILSLSLCACGESKEVQSMIFAMDTEMTVTAYGNKAQAGINAATGIITSMDAMLDPDLATSTVYALNNAKGQSVVVSGQIAEMITDAKTLYDQTEGALDLTVYPLSKLWGFIDSKYYVPAYNEIQELLPKVCFDKVVLTSFPSSGTFTVTMPEYAEISFGAIAKGCAAQKAVDAMRNVGVESGLVSLGGNVQTLGLKPDGSRWKVAIQDPNNASSYVGVLNVDETAVVTSGSYQRCFKDVATGETYHHILKPQTGYPISNNLVSVTVICPDGTMADALSTTMFVLGETQSLNYWRSHGDTMGGGFEMILITKDDRIICTSGLIEDFTLVNDSYTLSYSE